MTKIILAHSELTNTIYALIGKEKIDITEQAIAEVKAIKALEPKQGQWDKDGACPFCGYLQQWDDDNYCGHCGTRLTKINQDINQDEVEQ